MKMSTMSKGYGKLLRLWRSCEDIAPVLTAMLGKLCLSSKNLLGNADYCIRILLWDFKIQ
jgi:hypothetical protein